MWINNFRKSNLKHSFHWQWNGPPNRNNGFCAKACRFPNTRSPMPKPSECAILSESDSYK